ncbi:MAG: hypothetical protein P8105_08370 [Dehalococcoidia bacterium]
MEYNALLVAGLIGVAPGLIFWTAIVIVMAVKFKRTGKRAEHLLIAGAGLMLVKNLLTIPSAAIVPWLMHNGYAITQANSLISGYSIFGNIVGIAGILCFIYSFWSKFRVKTQDKIYA